MNCRKKLPAIFITDKEFETLSSTFLEKVVIGRDIFTKSSPVEIEQYKQFLEQSRPYDVVLDGLNIAFSTGINSPISPVDLVKT